MKEYITPDFDVTVYKLGDVIAAESSIDIDTTDPDGGEGWLG